MDDDRQGHLPQQVQIDAYGNGGFRFGGVSHRGSLLCLPTGMWTWSVVAVADLTVASLAPVLEAGDQIDVLLVGLGPEITAFDPAVRKALKDKGIIVEAVSTGSAVRTYNVLMAEQRAVAAALIAVEHAR
jgi:uncharacterized protein